MTHTPGPWHTNGGSAVFTQINAGGRKTYICETSGDPSINQRIANARLIAAAPDLLAACKVALTNLTPAYASDHLVLKSLIAAIAKAEGKS